MKKFKLDSKQREKEFHWVKPQLSHTIFTTITTPICSQTEFQLKWRRPSKGSARERKLIVFKLVVSSILLQCMESAFIPSPVSFTMLNDKTAMLSTAWAMNHSVEQLFTQKMPVLLIQQPEQSRSLSYKVTYIICLN